MERLIINLLINIILINQTLSLKAAMEAPIKPGMMWAQRKNKLMITIKVHDITQEKIELKPDGTFSFRGMSEGKLYGRDMQFYDEVDVESSKWNTRGRNIVLNIMKKNPGPHWPRLTKEPLKDQTLSVDWSQYVDEDEEDQKKEDDWEGGEMNNFDMGGAGNKYDDSDDEEEDDEEEVKEANPDLGDLEKEEEVKAEEEPKQENKEEPPKEEPPKEEPPKEEPPKEEPPKEEPLKEEPPKTEEVPAEDSQ